jgi:organic hydroperoxide reductase OsmC/OhrA
MDAAVTATPRVRPKEFHFPLSVEWVGGRRVSARVEGKRAIEIATPPVFRGTDPSAWSPEDFFVAAAASCLAVTFAGLADQAGLQSRALTVDGDGVVGLRPDGRFGFTRLLLQLEVEVEPGHEEQARELAEKAGAGCLVSVSLDLPVETVIDVHAVGAPALSASA